MRERRVTISEARRLLPSLVSQVARDGGRIEITRRGEPTVCLVRSPSAEASTERKGSPRASLIPKGCAIGLKVGVEQIEEDLRALRLETARRKRPLG